MFLVPWRQISDPKFGGLSRTSALNRSTSVDSNNFANTSRNLGNGAREDVANYYSLIGSRMRAIDWYQIGDFERRTSRYFALSYQNRWLRKPTTSKCLKRDQYAY